MKREKVLCVLLSVALVVLTGCGRAASAGSDGMESDTLSVDSLPDADADADGLPDEAEDARMDENFDDFIYAFVRNPRLQRERVLFPLPKTDVDGTQKMLRRLNVHGEFRFMEGDYYTVFYGDASQIEEQKGRPHEMVSVERLGLEDGRVEVYDFQRRDGRWMLTAIRSQGLAENELADFLVFYARFSSDTLFQQQCIAQPLRLSMFDPEEDDYIEGTIDARQWRSFCPEVPASVVTNIIYGQVYRPDHMVLQKCGSASGMQELFTFQRERVGWRLTSYEN